MAAEDLHWDDVRYFLALARSGSVRGAGGALGVSHSTVARRVQALEKRLRARLFDRSRDGYQLTDTGRRMVQEAEAVEARLAGLERDILGADDRYAGPVHLTCWDATVIELLLPALTGFTEQYPRVELHLSADVRPMNLSLREADVALRVLIPGTQPPQHLVGRRLVPMALAAFVAAEHADRLDPDRPGSAPRWLAYSDPEEQLAAIRTTPHRGIPLWGAFDSLEVMAAATRAGLGIGMLPCYLGDRDPVLCRLERSEIEVGADIWLLSHPDLRTTSRLKALRETVREAMANLAPLFAGQVDDSCTAASQP